MAKNPRYTFSRLFEGHRPGYPEAVLAKLAERMQDEDPKRPRTPMSAPSGYIYFAQFVDHDLVFDPTDVDDPNVHVLEPEKTRNKRTPRLDLETLYLTRLGTVAHPQDALLRIGPTEPSDAGGRPKFPSTLDDLPRLQNGLPDIWEQRNDVTLLIAQLHVLFLKFHNRIVQYLEAGKIESAGPAGGSLFEQAKRLVTLHYQWFVRYDFLPTMVQPDVLYDITMHWPKLYRPPKKVEAENVRLPVEFTQAAYQFGHSGVQRKYTLNKHLGFQIFLETMLLTGRGEFRGLPGSPHSTHTRLPAIAVVDPARMFGWAPPGKRNLADDLDTLIIKDLFAIPAAIGIVYTLSHFSALKRSQGSTLNLPLKTLRHGSLFGLPSGQEACNLAGVEPLGRDQIGRDDETTTLLRRNGILDRTPLFYYLMREAEVAGRRTPDGLPAKCLGPLASRIVAEVLLGVLTADPDSIAYANWRPPLVDFDNGREPTRIDTLKKFSVFADGYKESD
jgi:Animal haem peroxidase